MEASADCGSLLLHKVLISYRSKFSDLAADRQSRACKMFQHLAVSKTNWQGLARYDRDINGTNPDGSIRGPIGYYDRLAL